jgi:hypothetical protein
MVQWHPNSPLPDQLADCFAALYDWADSGLIDDIVSYGWAVQYERDPKRAELVASVRDSHWSTPRELRDHIERATHDRLGYAIYTVARAIDEGVGRYHPSLSGAGEATVTRSLINQYDRFGYYNLHADGYVLPRRGHGSRGQTLAGEFRHLLRAQVDRRRVRVCGAPHTAYSNRLEAPRIAVVPYLYTLDEVCFVGYERESGNYFAVHIAPQARPALEARLKEAVHQIREVGATIAIFPELVLDHGLFTLLSETLAETDSRRPSLEWVIVGRYSVGPEGAEFPDRNSAYVLDSSGAILCNTTARNGWIQHKRHRYKLTASEQRRYGLADLFPGDCCDREEAISIQSGAFVFETRWGRFAVLICEDWARDTDTVNNLRLLNCRAIFVPVMDGRVDLKRWVPKRFDFYKDEYGGSVFTANSMLLTNQERLTRERDLAAGKPVHEAPPGDPHQAAVGVLLVPDGFQEPYAKPQIVSVNVLDSGAPDGAVVSTTATLPDAAAGLQQALDAVI